MSIQWHKSTCPYCGFGCGLMVGVDQEKVMEVKGMKDHPANKGDICSLPLNYPPIFTYNDRLKRPMIRRNGQLVPVTWDEAISHVSAGFRQIIEKHDPDALAFYGGAINLTEEYYLMNNLMKAVIGTNNMDCSTRLCMASTAIGFISALGADDPPTCYADIEKSDLFLIAGNNMIVSLPILFRRICAAKEKNGTKVIVVDPRRTQTADIADIHLQIRPGTDVALNNSLAHILLKEGFVDEDKVDYYASGISDLIEVLKEYPPSIGAEITGCNEDLIIEAAHLIGNARAILSFWFQGYNHSTQAVFKNNTLHNILLLTENICRPGAGPLSITGEANAMGNRWVGVLYHLLPGMLIKPPGEAKPDCEIIWSVARAMGFKKEFPYTSPQEVFDEWKEITCGRICDMPGVTYERLRDKVGPQLPCSDAEHPGTQRLFKDWRFSRPYGRAALLARDYIEPAESTDTEYPFALITGRLAQHFNNRTRTGRSPILDASAPDGFIEMHQAYDKHSKQPEYKFSAVKISKIQSVQRGNFYE